tara:strand:- start:50 stop:463 length:414 start_codon:yes stop_codon:yes gene_type:complete
MAIQLHAISTDDAFQMMKKSWEKRFFHEGDYNNGEHLSHSPSPENNDEERRFHSTIELLHSVSPSFSSPMEIHGPEFSGGRIPEEESSSSSSSLHRSLKRDRKREREPSTDSDLEKAIKRSKTDIRMSKKEQKRSEQ